MTLAKVKHTKQANNAQTGIYFDQEIGRQDIKMLSTSVPRPNMNLTLETELIVPSAGASPIPGYATEPQDKNYGDGQLKLVDYHYIEPQLGVIEHIKIENIESESNLPQVHGPTVIDYRNDNFALMTKYQTYNDAEDQI